MVVLAGETFTLSQFRGLGHSTILAAGFGRPQEPLFPDRIFAQFLVELDSVTGNASAAQAAQAAAEDARDDAEGFRDEGEDFRDETEVLRNETESLKDITLAAATSVQFPFVTTGGTSAAYTASLGYSPTPSIGDAFALRVNIHTPNAANPTFNLDGTGALEMVDGQNLSGGGSYRSLGANEFFTGMNLILMKETGLTPNKWVITGGYPLYKLARDLDAAGFGIKNKRGYDYQVTYSGELEDGVQAVKMRFPTATRVYGLKRMNRVGTINAQFTKNGSQVISFTDSPSDTVHFTTSILTATIFEGGNAYLDFAAGDYIEITFSGNSGAIDSWMAWDIQENYAA